MSEQTTEDQDVEPNVPPAEPDEPANPDEPTSEVDDQISNPGKSEEETEPDTFPRDYVEKLRDENAKFRQRAQKSDELAHRLHTTLVAADGRLADPTDLEFSAENLEDAESLSEAIGELLKNKPHLAARRPRGDVGQGASGGSNSAVDLAGLLRAGAN